VYVVLIVAGLAYFSVLGLSVSASAGHGPQKVALRARLSADEKLRHDANAPGMIRTCDLCLRRAALYPLSYGRGAT
jgi:hypothetical protein